jgi:hypothetical protein
MVFVTGTATRSVQADEGERAVWAQAESACDADSFFAYLSQFPSGQYVEQALMALIEMGALGAEGREMGTETCVDDIQVVPLGPGFSPTETPTTPVQQPESALDPYQ